MEEIKVSYLDALFLALIQGLTEFLPISSSAHLILFSETIGNFPGNIIYDVSLHFGTLIAAIFYFRVDLLEIYHSILEHKSFFKNKLLKQLIISSIPTLFLGFILANFIDSYLRTGYIIAFTTILFGLILFLATFSNADRKTMKDTTLKDALIMGLAQSISLVPGVSRSGVTISAGLFLGLDNKTASKFSFLMSVPVISAIALYLLLKTDANYLVDNFELNIFGVFISFIIAYLTIDLFIKLINKIGFLPFIIYRIILGITIFYFLT